MLERDRIQQELTQESALRQTEAKYREKAQELEVALDNLKQAQMQLIQTEKMSSLGQLVAGIAHEINNPLNFIAGNLIHTESYFQELLQTVHLYQARCQTDQPVPDGELTTVDLPFIQQDIPKLLESMRSGTQRIRNIVQSLHHFARTNEPEKRWLIFMRA
jgi:signal transduction histidine kinase